MKRNALLLPLLAAVPAAAARTGFDADDPVRVPDVASEYVYVARLRGADGEPVAARRTGSSRVDGFAMPVDAWLVETAAGAEESLSAQLAPLPEGMLPFVIAGGSFNSSRRRTQLRDEDRTFIDTLLAQADPARIFFVVGHTLSAQEGYLVRKATGTFRIFAIVPSQITPQEKARLQAAGVGILVSIESSGMGLYKSFSYEVFRRMPSVLLAFDGNSAALNLIQEARNGRNKCRIYIKARSRGLSAKADLLKGYVTFLQDPTHILQEANALRTPEAVQGRET